MFDIFATWPHRWFGWFEVEPTDAIPMMSQLVDKTWHPADRELILQYLEQAPVYETTSTDPRPCLLCGETLFELGTWRWDNKWLWPDCLLHDVAVHSLRLPDEMVKDIRSKNYCPPKEGECDCREAEKVMDALTELVSNPPAGADPGPS